MTTRKQVRDAIGTALGAIDNVTVFTGRHMALTDSTEVAVGVMINEGDVAQDLAGGATTTAVVVVVVTTEGQDDDVDVVAEQIPPILHSDAGLRAVVHRVSYTGFEFDREAPPQLASVALLFSVAYNDG